MGKGREEVEIAFNLEVESRRALKGLTAVDNSLKKIFGRKLDLGDSFDSKSVKEFRKELGGSRDDLKELERAFKHSKFDTGFKKSFDNIKKEQAKLRRVLFDGEAAIAAAAATGDKKKEAAVKEHWKRHTIEAQKGLKREQLALRKATSREDVAQHLKRRTLLTKYAKGENVGREPSQNQKDVADAITSGFSSLSGKDLLGVGKAGAKLSSLLAHGLGKKSIAAGDKLQDRGDKRGGKLGTAMKMMGGVMKGGGGVMASLAEMGPMLGMIGGAVASLVKLLVDVEAKAKEMNKAILEGAATSSYMASSMGNADLAAAKLESTLNSVRDQATNIRENVKWGTNSEDVIRVANAYGQQGMALDMLGDSLERAQKSGDASAASMGDFGTMARVSFGYSKALGVSLQEITDFQGEMFTEMGASLGDLRLEFARMTRDAGESGIAANKFFGILRGVSADLSLYTTRLGQASSALKLIGKSMNSREAGKFLQSITNGYKQMSEEDRLRATLIAGEPVMREIVNKDLLAKTKKFYAEVAQATGASIEDVQAAAEASTKDSGRAMEALLGKTDEGKKKSGTLMGTLSELNMDKNALKNGDRVGVAEAASNLSLGAGLDATKARLAKFGGQGKLHDLTGIKGLASRKAAGMTLEETRSFAKLEDTLDRQKDNLLAVLKKRDEGGTLSKEEQMRLDKMKSLGMDNKDAVAKAGFSDMINTMEDSEQEALAASKEQENFQEKTANLTRGVMELLQLAIDGIFESMYQVMLSIWDILSRAPILGGNPEKTAVQKEVLSSKNPAMMKLFKETGGDPKAMREALIGKGGAKVQEMAASSGVEDKISSAYKASPRALQEAMFKSGIVNNEVFSDKNSTLRKGIDSGKSYSDITKDMNLSPGQKKEMNKAMIEAMTTDQLVAMGTSAAPTQAQQIAAGAAGTGASGPVAPLAATPSVVSTERRAAVTTRDEPAPMTEKDVIDRIDLTGKDTVRNLQDLWTLMSGPGIRINKSHLGTDVEPVIKKGVLEGVREALFEQAVYSSSNPTALLEKMSNSGFGGVSSLAQSYKPAAAHAAGGAVTGVANGMAVFAPPGEGLTSIGPGERIVPSNAGGGAAGAVHLHVNGLGGADLAAYLKTKVAEGIYEYKRREKL